MLYKNMHKLKPTDLISITYKMHGTSGISSKVICKKKLTWYEKFLKKCGVNIVDTEYSNLYSSRKVIKNEELNPNAQHYYSDDIWTIADKYMRQFLDNGLTAYYEIVGYLPSGGMIQKDYDYGYVCPGPGVVYTEGETFGVHVYRLTYTSASGKVHEFSAKQVQDWCRNRGVSSVPQLWYGYACNLFPEIHEKFQEEEWRSHFLEALKEEYNEKECYMCKYYSVPEEGIVLRIEKEDLEAYKLKSNAFYERETKELDKGESNIEDEN